jgi:hypothetical protein
LTPAASPGKLQHYGLLRMVRDVFHISGFLVFDALGQLIEIVLNRSAPLAPTLVTVLPQLLTLAHVAIRLGET